MAITGSINWTNPNSKGEFFPRCTLERWNEVFIEGSGSIGASNTITKIEYFVFLETNADLYVSILNFITKYNKNPSLTFSYPASPYYYLHGNYNFSTPTKGSFIIPKTLARALPNFDSEFYKLNNSYNANLTYITLVYYTTSTNVKKVLKFEEGFFPINIAPQFPYYHYVDKLNLVVPSYAEEGILYKDDLDALFLVTKGKQSKYVLSYTEPLPDGDQNSGIYEFQEPQFACKVDPACYYVVEVDDGYDIVRRSETNNPIKFRQNKKPVVDFRQVDLDYYENYKYEGDNEGERSFYIKGDLYISVKNLTEPNTLCDSSFYFQLENIDHKVPNISYLGFSGGKSGFITVPVDYFKRGIRYRIGASINDGIEESDIAWYDNYIYRPSIKLSENPFSIVLKNGTVVNDENLSIYDNLQINFTNVPGLTAYDVMNYDLKMVNEELGFNLPIENIFVNDLEVNLDGSIKRSPNIKLLFSPTQSTTFLELQLKITEKGSEIFNLKQPFNFIKKPQQGNLNVSTSLIRPYTNSSTKLTFSIPNQDLTIINEDGESIFNPIYGLDENTIFEIDINGYHQPLSFKKDEIYGETLFFDFDFDKAFFIDNWESLYQFSQLNQLTSTSFRIFANTSYYDYYISNTITVSTDFREDPILSFISINDKTANQTTEIIFKEGDEIRFEINYSGYNDEVTDFTILIGRSDTNNKDDAVWSNYLSGTIKGTAAFSQNRNYQTLTFSRYASNVDESKYLFFQIQYTCLAGKFLISERPQKDTPYRSMALLQPKINLLSKRPFKQQEIETDPGYFISLKDIDTGVRLIGEAPTLTLGLDVSKSQIIFKSIINDLEETRTFSFSNLLESKDFSILLNEVNPDWEYLQGQILLKLCYKTENYREDLTKTWVVEYFDLYNIMPTISYRKNQLGINTNLLDEIEDNDKIIALIGQVEDKHQILYHSSNEKYPYCIIQNFLFDCGSWDEI